MDRVWVKNYQAGVPHEINPEEFQSIPDFFQHTCATYENRPAFQSFGHTITFKEINELSKHFAAFLQKKLGLEKGDRVGLMMPNILQYPVCLFGALRAGLTVVNINPLYTPDELAHQVNDSGLDTIVVLDHFAHTVEQVISRTKLRHIVLTKFADALPFAKRHLINTVVKYVKKLVPAYDIDNTISYRQALSFGAKSTFDAVSIQPEDIAFLQYTGGTTGRSKGAMLTHRNMVANIEQSSSWIIPICESGEEIIITALPLYHIFSLLANCFTFMRIGALNILIANPRDTKAFVNEISKVPFTAITAVNTLFNSLLHNKQFRELDFSALKLSLGGGMAVQQSVAEKWKEVTGNTLLQAYGLTETSPAVTINPMYLTSYNGSIGLPLASTEVSIQTDDGKHLPIGETGELCVRGPQVMRGYWNNEAETQAVLSKDGWLKTGDMGYVDEQGYVYIVDRKKDMILVSGFNVYPNEVEEVLVSHPSVVEAGVAGNKREDGNEIVTAFVVRKDSSLDEATLRSYCKEHLTGYKVPKDYLFLEELPKSNVGKVLRKDLKLLLATN